MLGSIAVQWCYERLARQTALIDRNITDRISGVSLDFLVTGATATVKIAVINEHLVPFLIMGAAIFLFCLFSM